MNRRNIFKSLFGIGALFATPKVAKAKTSGKEYIGHYRTKTHYFDGSKRTGTDTMGWCALSAKKLEKIKKHSSIRNNVDKYKFIQIEYEWQVSGQPFYLPE